MNYDLLAELARREEQAVQSRDWEELIAIQAEQLELLDSLPETPPREAQAVLEHALECCRSTQRSLFASLAETQGIMERLGTGRRALGGYTTDRRSTLDARG